MVVNSTNINKMNNRFSSQLNTKDHDMWRWKSRSWHVTGTNCGGLKPVIGIPTLPSW